MLHFHLLPSPSLPAVRAREPTLLCPSVKFQHLSQKTQIPVRARPSRGLQLGAESISKRLEAAAPVHRAISHCPSPHPETAAGVGPVWLLVLVSAELCQLLSAEFLAPRADCLIANRVFWEIGGGA